jgi:hypothetical protein
MHPMLTNVLAAHSGHYQSKPLRSCTKSQRRFLDRGCQLDLRSIPAACLLRHRCRPSLSGWIYLPRDSGSTQQNSCRIFLVRHAFQNYSFSRSRSTDFIVAHFYTRLAHLRLLFSCRLGSLVTQLLRLRATALGFIPVCKIWRGLSLPCAFVLKTHL